MTDDEINGLDLGRAGNHVTHGGAGGLKKIETGQPLVGLAAREEHAVEVELAQPDGRRTVVLKGAQRLEACARLYWNATLAALDAGDIKTATAFVKVFAWVQSSAIRAMLAVDQVEKPRQLTLDGLLGKDGDGEN